VIFIRPSDHALKFSVHRRQSPNDLVGARWRVRWQLRFFGVKIDDLTDLKFILGHREQLLAFDFGGRKGAPDDQRRLSLLERQMSELSDRVNVHPLTRACQYRGAALAAAPRRESLTKL
jgi:hypothetical protein